MLWGHTGGKREKGIPKRGDWRHCPQRVARVALAVWPEPRLAQNLQPPTLLPITEFPAKQQQAGPVPCMGLQC